MNTFELLSILITFSIGVGYINMRFLKLQASIATMIASLLFSLLIVMLGHFGFSHLETTIEQTTSNIDFHQLLINGFLGFLLFAGALNIDLNDLRDQKWEIGILSSLGTIASTVLIGFICYYLLPLIGIHLGLIYCMLFGALISPTDPIAVLAIFKKVGAPKRLDTCLAGESLFNDGVAVVIFLTIFELATGGTQITFTSVSTLFLRQAIGGILYGMLLGYLGYRLIKPIDDYKMEIFITLIITTGGYALAQAINISGPLAMVVAGLFIGNHSRQFYMSQASRERLDHFWELVDELLNALLFFIIGLEVLVVPVNKHSLIAGIIMIPIVLLVRFITVAAPIGLMHHKRDYHKYTIRILTWGGLRGGLAVALALVIPEGHARDIILPMTFAVVLFSIIFQGLTVKPLVKLSK